MALNKENAAPEVTVGAATGQHLCNSEISISNEAQTGNENIACTDKNPDISSLDKSSLNELSMTELYDRVYEPKAPVVEGLLYPGTYIFAGSPKVGKSFFMAQLAYHVAAGIPLWDYPVRQGAVLYLALEDDYARLQKRLSRMFGVESSDSLYLVTESGTVSDGLEAQLEQFVARHPDTALIIIDTLQRIREIGGEQYSYAKDYELIKLLKAFTDKQFHLLPGRPPYEENGSRGQLRYDLRNERTPGCRRRDIHSEKEETDGSDCSPFHRRQGSAGPGTEARIRPGKMLLEICFSRDRTLERSAGSGAGSSRKSNVYV